MKTDFNRMLLIIFFLGISLNLAVEKSSFAQGRVYATGLNFLSKTEYMALPRAPTLSSPTDLPLSHDLSEKFPTPGNQGSQGSCVGWASAYIKSYYDHLDDINLQNKPSKLSPSYIYNQVRASKNGCDSGASIKAGLDLLKTQGVLKLKDFPYTSKSCNRVPTQRQMNSASAHKLLDYKTENFRDRAQVQTKIFRGIPILIGFRVPDNFFAIGTSVYTKPSAKIVGGHAAVVVGYDNNRNAYKMLNSWGSSWGDRGFGWIAVPTLESLVIESYSINDRSDSNQEWNSFQICRNNGGARCCDHLSKEFAKVSQLCGHQPNLDRQALYSWCVYRNDERCCDHLEVSVAERHPQCGPPLRASRASYLECISVGTTRDASCCTNLTPALRPQYDLCSGRTVRASEQLTYYNECDRRAGDRCCEHLETDVADVNNLCR